MAAKVFDLEREARKFRLALDTVQNVGLQRRVGIELDTIMTKVSGKKDGGVVEIGPLYYSS